MVVYTGKSSKEQLWHNAMPFNASAAMAKMLLRGILVEPRLPSIQRIECSGLSAKAVCGFLSWVKDDMTIVAAKEQVQKT